MHLHKPPVLPTPGEIILPGRLKNPKVKKGFSLQIMVCMRKRCFCKTIGKNHCFGFGSGSVGSLCF